MRNFGAQTYINLKVAFRDLVALAGGVNRAVSVTRGCQSKMSESVSLNMMSRFPAIDQIADLEADCGQPVMTRLLAELAGYSLSPLVANAKQSTMLQHLSAISRDAGSFGGQLADAIADGKIDAKERQCLIVAVNALMDNLVSVKASIHASVPPASIRSAS